MGASQSRRVHVFQDLADKTGFSIEQIRNLHDRFMYLTQEENILRREHLDNISYLAFNPIRRQIIEVFFDKRNLGQNEAGSLQEIGFEEFLTVLAFFRPPKPHATEEEIENIKRAKLRCETKDFKTSVVEKLLSSYETLDTENAKVISDAAMLEVASVTMGQMGPDEFYDGISFEHFLQILKGIEIETKMHIRFLNMNTTTMHFFNRE
ncbi:calcineurin B homologous protein 3-like isoform X2 [Myxocyprinus asiaticus]|uniref:calcineurin B homologous protein 3-like isoform X2 n=1 Tax=Myxocyprinus asiaticus TaxID=70543 RepID=UPI0022222499|nr:calcineurin B homologous protein 3-like isoform X2 [Myxocyprinus asiaticus]